MVSDAKGNSPGQSRKGLTMTVTTSYGSWNNHAGGANTNLEGDIADYINGGDADWRHRVEESGAFEEMADAYRDAINNALPEGVTLAGDEFYGPYYEADHTWDGDLDIADIIESVDLGAIVETHDPDNEEEKYDAEHGYMAAIGTAHDVVAGDYSDVTVTEAAADLNVDEDGNETLTPVFGTTVVYGPVDTVVRTDDEDQLFKVEVAAEALLEQAGWEVTGPWQITDNALYATVERA